MVFKRMGDMISATINEGLDQMENPRVMLNQYLRDMESEVSKAKHAIVKQQTIEQSFQRKMEEARQLSSKRKDQAQLAFDAGEEDLARTALAEMKHYEAKVQQYKEFYDKATQQVRELKGQLSQLEEKFQALKDKKYALIARANAAKAKEHMNASINQIDSESSFREFQRLEDRIHEMEIKANTWGATGVDSDTNQFIKLEYADAAEKELDRMRQAKGTTSTSTASANNKKVN